MVNKYQLFDTLVFYDQQKQHLCGTNIPYEDIDLYYKANKCSAKMDMDIGHPCCVWRRDNLSSSKVDKYWNNFLGAEKLGSMTLESGVLRLIL